ncbi:NUDIX domain-containing protein [Candidatus Woesebacteria bacterium]|nr:NUDIX domain-containing protein [Candidatus Woesebacteria bacterium]
MTQKRFIDKLAYIHIVDHKLLVTLSKGKDTWYIPGGKREDGETDFQALIREVKEELSVDLLEETIHKYGVFEAQAHGKPEGTVVRMTCYTAEYLGEIHPDSEIEKVEYFDYAQKAKTSPVDNLIFDDLFKKGLIL